MVDDLLEKSRDAGFWLLATADVVGVFVVFAVVLGAGVGTVCEVLGSSYTLLFISFCKGRRK